MINLLNTRLAFYLKLKISTYNFQNFIDTRMLLTNLKTSNKNWNIFDAITLLRVDESKGHTYTKILLSCTDTKHVENLIYIPPLP